MNRKEAKVVIPPNHGWVEYKLDQKELDYVWRCIENKKKDFKYQLAGNIDASVSLKDRSEWFFRETIRPLIVEYEQTFGSLGNDTPINQKFEYHMPSWWVNYQRQNEFNPIHHHGGVYSFVIWMKIPTSHFQQNKKSIALKSNSPSISSFNFIYNDILGRTRTYPYELSPKDDGKMVLFSSKLHHLVYPFYDCDETRVSVSGNISFNTSRVMMSNVLNNQP